MGKYENVLKCIQIHRLVDEKKYQKALETVRTLDMDKVTVVSDLKVIADVYMKMDQYEKAKEVYYRIYDKVKTYRVLYRLIILAIRSGNIKEAEELFELYESENQTCSDRLILKYRLQKAKGEVRERLIRTLEELKENEYIEEWAYELAKLYHKEELKEKCIQECKDIILWFGEGEIVNKAKVLKKHYDGELDLSSTQDLEEVLKDQVSGMMEDVDGKDKTEDVLESEKVDDGETKRIVIQNMKEEEEKAAEEERSIRLSETQKISDKLKLSDALKLNRILKESKGKQEGTLLKEDDSEDESNKKPGEEPIKEELIKEKPKEEEPKEEEPKEEEPKEVEPKEEEPKEEEPKEEEPKEEEPKKEELKEKEPKEEEPKEELEREGEQEEPEREMKEVQDDVLRGYRRRFVVVEDFFLSLVNTDKEIQIVIAGEEDRFILAVVKKITKRLKENGYLTDGKIARIHAEKLNKIDLMKKSEELVGGCMLVEEASKLDAEAIINLKRFMEEYARKTIVILTDLPEKVKEMLHRDEELDEKITHFLEI